MKHLNTYFALPIMIGVITLGLVVTSVVQANFNFGPAPLDHITTDQWFDIEGRSTIRIRFEPLGAASKIKCFTTNADCFPKPDHKFMIVKFQAENLGRFTELVEIDATLTTNNGETFTSWLRSKNISINYVILSPTSIGHGHDIFEIPSTQEPVSVEGYFFGPETTNIAFKFIVN
tara:strand:- start:192 stop:716 length:525 start_codon:yes stop_codon:yes gene_type:complete